MDEVGLPIDDASDTVGDFTCIECGYILRGLSRGGRCPECGEAIIISIDRNRLVCADPKRLRLIQVGFGSLAILPMLAVFAIPMAMLSELFLSAYLVVLSLWFLATLYLVTVRPLQSPAESPGDEHRRLMVTLTSCGLVTGIVTVFGEAMWGEVIFAVAGVVCLCCVLLLGYVYIVYGALLAGLADHGKLSGQFLELRPYYITAAIVAIILAVLIPVGDYLATTVSEFDLVGAAIAYLLILPLSVLGGICGFAATWALIARFLELAMALSRNIRRAKALRA